MSEVEELIAEVEAGVEAGDKTRVLKAFSQAMELAEAEADLAAAGTAIDSNLAKLKEIGELQQRLTDCDILLADVSILTQGRADVARAKNRKLLKA